MSYPKIIHKYDSHVTMDDGTVIEVPVYEAIGYPDMTYKEDSIRDAIEDLRRLLPGWWFTVGECSVSCDATVGPDKAFVPEPYLSMFDEGFSVDLAQPSTISDALREATREALCAFQSQKGKQNDK